MLVSLLAVRVSGHAYKTSWLLCTVQTRGPQGYVLFDTAADDATPPRDQQPS